MSDQDKEKTFTTLEMTAIVRGLIMGQLDQGNSVQAIIKWVDENGPFTSIEKSSEWIDLKKRYYLSVGEKGKVMELNREQHKEGEA